MFLSSSHIVPQLSRLLWFLAFQDLPGSLDYSEFLPVFLEVPVVSQVSLVSLSYTMRHHEESP